MLMKRHLSLFLLFINIFYVYSQHNVTSITVNPKTKSFIDNNNRELYFHGVNVVYKIPPWTPPSDTFDVYQSFGEIDMQYLQEWGLNSVRFGVMWAGVEPEQRGVYNTTYLNYLRNTVDMMQQYNIFALLDCHQDLYSWVYCGDGAPAWASVPKGGKQFPEPIDKPYQVDNNTLVPSGSQCGKHPWASYYGSEAVSGAFQSLYDNYEGIQDAFSGYWQQVADTFKSSQNVLGYELINEPWAGDIFRDPLLLIPGEADRKNLAPMYNRLVSDLRTVDPYHVIFFEGVTFDDFGTGFEQIPGGPEYLNTTAYSYHYYVPPDISINEFYWARKRDMEKLGCAGMLTEFGGDSGTSESVVQDTISTMSAAESHLQGWMFWIYKDFVPDSYADLFFFPNGTADESRVKLFSRTFAQAVSGVTISSLFDWETSKYVLTFTPNREVAALAAPDTTDLILPFEVTNFYVQHYALLIAPFILHIYKYSIKLKWGYAMISSSFVGFAHFILFEICSLFSGININYMLSPPPLGNLSFLSGKYEL
eukprot:gene7754-9539_t